MKPAPPVTRRVMMEVVNKRVESMPHPNTWLEALQAVDFRTFASILKSFRLHPCDSWTG
jgi:hypothetical protein